MATSPASSSVASTGTRRAAASTVCLNGNCRRCSREPRAASSWSATAAGTVGDDRDIGELLTQSSTELAPIAIGYVADQQGRRRARRLDDCAHQGAVIDQQRLEPEGTQDFRHSLRALRIAVIDDRPLQGEGSQSCRVAQVHLNPCALVRACFCLGGILSVCVSCSIRLSLNAPRLVNYCQKFGARLRERLSAH